MRNVIGQMVCLLFCLRKQIIDMMPRFTVNYDFFARILFPRIALKDIFAKLKNSQLAHGLPTSVNDRVIPPFRKGFIFMNRENKTFAKISQLTIVNLSPSGRTVYSIMYS